MSKGKTMSNKQIELGTMLDIKQVAQTFGVSPQTIRKWVRSGDLKAFWLVDVMRFRPEDVADFITRNQTERASA